MSIKKKRKKIDSYTAKKRKLRDECDDLWKQIILKRYDYVCELCGEDWRLTAHHYYFKGSVSHLRYELDNGICLCGKCHASLHWKGNDQKLVEDKIVKLRGTKWINRLKKKRANKPKYFTTTLGYYQEIKEELLNKLK